MMVRLLVAVGVLLALPATALAQSWSSAANTVWQRAAATAATSSGVLYAVGNTSSGYTVDAFDPASNTWSSKAPLGGAFLADVNGTLWGGTALLGDGSTSLFKYNASTNSWGGQVSTSAVPGATQKVAIGTQLYFVTRFGSPSGQITIGLIVYDTVANTWTTKVGQFQGGTAYQDSTAAVLNGKIYFVGGMPINGGQVGAQPILEEYDPTANTWTQKASLPTPVGSAGVAAVNGKLYVVGGYGNSIVNGSFQKAPLGTTQVWDPTTNTWSTLGNLQTVRWGLGLSAIGSTLYAIDGTNGTQGVATVEKLTVAAAYYRIKNRWQGTYMNTEHLTGYVEVSSICPTCQSAMWSIEDSGQGYVRLKNRWTGKYMHIQDLTGRVQYGDIYPQWDSAKWFLDDFNGFKRVRNLWQNLFVHIENLTGYAQYGTVYDTWESAQWTLEPVQ